MNQRNEAVELVCLLYFDSTGSLIGDIFYGHQIIFYRIEGLSRILNLKSQGIFYNINYFLCFQEYRRKFWRNLIFFYVFTLSTTLKVVSLAVCSSSELIHSVDPISINYANFCRVLFKAKLFVNLLVERFITCIQGSWGRFTLLESFLSHLL
jgi:hypothetical protein